MKQVTPEQFSSFLERINIPTHIDPYPSIALGACDLSLFEMMWGYSIFPGHGFSTKPSFISRIEDRNGNVIKRFDFGANRKDAVNEIAAYQMVKMMEGPVTVGTAAGLMQRLGAKEMGGKTGTTNNNADFWFMGFTPQLLAGTWVGSDDRFIQIESAAFYGGTAARPIWEAFFKKVYADKSLGIQKDAEFVKPADLENAINGADDMRYWDPVEMDSTNNNGSKQDEYGLDTTTYIPAESKAPEEDDDAKKDNKPKKDTTKGIKIGEMNPTDKKEKKGLLRKIFGKKDDKKKDNEY
jgi:penicillin-binding protein 1A